MLLPLVVSHFNQISGQHIELAPARCPIQIVVMKKKRVQCNGLRFVEPICHDAGRMRRVFPASSTMVVVPQEDISLKDSQFRFVPD